jgi:P4 family phage/plasmid primase-like protien
MLETTLGRFLDSRRVIEKGEPCSFTGMGALKGKFMVKENEYSNFLTLLHEYLFTQNRRPLNLVEQRRCDLHTPILIDLDFKYPPERAIERSFQLSHVHEFIRNYVGHLIHFYHIIKPLRFFITLRPGPYEDKKQVLRSIKDGVHIQCPDLVLPSEHQQVLRHRSLEKGDVAHAFLQTGYINPEKDIFDEAVSKKNGWFFYGESKPDIPAYHLASVYVYNPSTNNFIDHKTEYKSDELLPLLSIRHQLNLEIPERETSTQEEWQTRLDICTGRRSAEVEEEKVIVVSHTNKSDFIDEEEFTLAKRLVLECLSDSRSESYSTWMEIGWCLHYIDSSDKMFEVWMEFSQRSSKSTQNQTAQLLRDWKRGWNRNVERPFTIRSLHMWAKQDNPRKYKEIMTGSFIQFVENEVDATHTHIARLMKRMYKNDYCAAVDSKKTEWYFFTGVYWKKLAQGIELRNKMITEVADVISETRVKIRRGIDPDAEEETWNNTRLKKMTKIEQCLYTSGFKDSVMKECVGLFYEEDFLHKLNANPYIIGFNNGVIDLHAIKEVKGKQEYTVQFRKAEPNDFITFLAGRCVTKQCDPIDYIEYDPMDTEQQVIHDEIDDFMRKLFPKPELCAYMWRKLASCLEGANKEQTYETWIGVGGNGKSKLVDLMSITLGDYASSLQSTALTRKRPDSGAANPDIMAIRNKRFIYMAEPDDREPLNTSRMKQFTGEDDVEARGLFEDQTKFKITGKIFMLCNAFPAIHTMDRGTWRRVRAVPFESKFVDTNCEETNPKEFIYERDPLLDKKMISWRMHFMSRLIHIYKTEYLVSGLGQVPAIITRESTKYQESFDSVAKFMNARIREIKKGGYEANIKDIFRVYKQWYESVGGMGRKLTQAELYKRLSDKCGEPLDKKTFKQIRLFDEEVDIEEYDQSLSESS